MKTAIGWAIVSVPFLTVAALILRFHLPMSWRIASPRWDRLLCKLDSHRCRNACGLGCCWECLRCRAEREGKLDEHYREAREFIAGRRS